MIAEVKVDEKEVQEGLKKLFSSFSCFCAQVIFSVLANGKMNFFQLDCFCQIDTPTPWLTLLLVLGKSRVKQNSC